MPPKKFRRLYFIFYNKTQFFPRTKKLSEMNMKFAVNAGNLNAFCGKENIIKDPVNFNVGYFET